MELAEGTDTALLCSRQGPNAMCGIAGGFEFGALFGEGSGGVTWVADGIGGVGDTVGGRRSSQTG